MFTKSMPSGILTNQKWIYIAVKPKTSVWVVVHAFLLCVYPRCLSPSCQCDQFSSRSLSERLAASDCCYSKTYITYIHNALVEMVTWTPLCTILWLFTVDLNCWKRSTHRAIGPHCVWQAAALCAWFVTSPAITAWPLDNHSPIRPAQVLGRALATNKHW